MRFSQTSRAALRQLRAALVEAARDARRAWNRTASAWVGIFVLAAVVPPAVAGSLETRDLAAGLYVALAAVGLNFAVGLAGMPSLGQGAFMGIGAFGAAYLRARSGWDPVAATAAGVGLSVGTGALVAAGAVRLRATSVAIATWVVSWLVAVGLAAFPRISGGAQGLVVPDARVGFGSGLSFALTPGVHYEMALALLSLALLVFWVVSRSPVGLGLAAARQGPAASSALGVPAARLQRGAFVASAAIGGLAGALAVQLSGVADPTAYGPLLSVELFIAVLLGGAGTALGPVLGAVVLAVIPRIAQGLGAAAGVSAARFEPVVASVLLLAVLVLGRGGVLAWLEPLLRRPARRPPVATMAGEPAVAPGAPRAPKPDLGLPPVSGPKPRLEALQARDLAKRFGGVVALDGVSFGVRAAEIHALIGPNGSGKTTCLRVLAGTLPPDTGTVLLDGRDVTGDPTRERVQAGLVRTLPRTAVFPDLTVRQHVLAGASIRRRHGGTLRTLFATPLARREEAGLRGWVDEALAVTGLARAADIPVRRLANAEQRVVMLATAFASRPRVLLADEPSTGMSPRDADRVARLLLDLREWGLTLVIVEHNLPLVHRLADRVTVLDAGRIIARGTPAEVAADREVVRVYLGTDLAS